MLSMNTFAQTKMVDGAAISPTKNNVKNAVNERVKTKKTLAPVPIWLAGCITGRKHVPVDTIKLILTVQISVLKPKK